MVFFLIELDEYVLRNVPTRLRSNAEALGFLGRLSLELKWVVSVMVEVVVIVEPSVVFDFAAGEDVL